MTRTQKKCLVFSVGMHGTLAGVLFFGAGFQPRPDDSDAQVLSIIPANTLDRAGAGGGTPAARVSRPLEPLPPSEIVGRVEHPKPITEEQQPLPRPNFRQVQSMVAPSHRHEIHPTYTPAAAAAVSKSAPDNSDAAQARAAAELKRLREVEQSLSQLSSTVEARATEKTSVDVPGVGGAGEAFAGYNEAVKSIYYRAWITQDYMADATAGPVARIVVARDGTIISAELTTPSGDEVLDKSVERALRRVTRLPAFPAGARDEERTFRIRFSLDAKKASG
jgi:TonB family protein